MITSFIRGAVVVVVCLSIFCLKMPAQSSYGSIVGTVTDPSGAIVPDAPITLTNLGTSQQLKTASNASGDYQFVNLQPGNYKVDIEKSGFKRLTRDRVEVAVSVATRVDAVMQVGDVAQRVEVTGETPLLNTEDATVGQVVEGRAVLEMPLNGRNVMNVIQLTPGVVPHGQSQGQQARSGNANYQISGGMPGQGKTLADGVPLNTGLFNGQGGVPIQDTIQEFQVMADNLPPEFGGTLNGIITLATKAGTNDFHGTAYEFIRNRVLNANDFFSNHAGLPRGAFTQNQYGLNGGGPIIRNKTFISLAWEAFTQRVGATTAFTVPTLAERTGDFSGLTTASGALIPIYDPMTTCGQFGNPPCTGQPMRTQFPGNKIPASRFDPTAAIMLKYWPLPKTSGVTNTNANNFVENASQPDDRDWEHLRFDQVLGSKQRMFGTFDRYNSITPPFDYYGLGINFVEVQGDDRGMLADTYTFNSTTVADVRVAYSHTIYTRVPNTTGLDLSTIGWPSSYNSQFLTTALPVIDVTGFSNSDGGQTSTDSDSTIQSQRGGVAYAASSLTKIAGRHSIRLGGEYSWLPTAYGAGKGSTFAFTNNFTALNPLSPGNTGSGFASYLLGLGNSGSTGNALFPMMNMHMGAAYIGDAFKPTTHLDLNFGIRWEYPGYWSERHGREAVFQSTATNPVLSGAGLNYPGDVVLVNSPRYSRGINQVPHWHLFSPRVSATYRWNNNAVLRLGYGISFTPGPYQEYIMPFEEPLVSATTAWVPTQNSGLTPVATLSNPFPGGILAAPGRSSTYESSILGSALVVPSPQNSTPYVQNWNVGFERQLGNSSVIDVTYVGTHAVHLSLEGDGTPAGGPNVNQLPDQYDAMGSALLTSVANPFYGLIKTGALSTKTIPAGQLLLPFPQFTTVYDPGKTYLDAHYNALEAKFQRRFQAGGNLLVSYTYSKNYGNADTIYGHTEPFKAGTVQDYTNEGHAESSLLSFDVRNLLVVSYVQNLPFGQGQLFLGASTGLVNHLVSGWGVDGATTWQSGFPLPLIAEPTTLNTDFGAGTPRPNFTVGCNKITPGSQPSRINNWFNTSCFTQPSTFGFGDEPRTDPNIRNSGIANSDFAVFRNVAITERLNMQFRAEFFNLFNRVQFGPPGNEVGTAQFGVVSSQYNNPRLIQFAVRFTY